MIGEDGGSFECDITTLRYDLRAVPVPRDRSDFRRAAAAANDGRVGSECARKRPGRSRGDNVRRWVRAIANDRPRNSDSRPECARLACRVPSVRRLHRNGVPHGVVSEVDFEIGQIRVERMQLCGAYDAGSMERIARILAPGFRTRPSTSGRKMGPRKARSRAISPRSSGSPNDVARSPMSPSRVSKRT